MKPAAFSSDCLYLADPTDRRIARNVTPANRVVATLSNPEFLALLAICGIGLLATTVVSAAVPSFVDLIASLQQFL